MYSKCLDKIAPTLIVLAASLYITGETARYTANAIQHHVENTKAFQTAKVEAGLESNDYFGTYQYCQETDTKACNALYFLNTMSSY